MFYRVSLPFYDFDGVRQYNDQFWGELRGHLADSSVFQDEELPLALERGAELADLYASENLLLTQACCFEVVDQLSKLELVGSFVYGSEASKAKPLYQSVLLTHKESGLKSLGQFAGKRAVMTSRTSHAGLNALRLSFAGIHEKKPLFEEVIVSGSQLGSISILSEQKAEVGCIDQITYGLLQEHSPEKLENLLVLGVTPQAPAPPVVCSPSISGEQREVLHLKIAQTVRESEAARALHIHDFVAADTTDFVKVKKWKDSLEGFILDAQTSDEKVFV